MVGGNQVEGNIYFIFIDAMFMDARTCFKILDNRSLMRIFVFEGYIIFL